MVSKRKNLLMISEANDQSVKKANRRVGSPPNTFSFIIGKSVTTSEQAVQWKIVAIGSLFGYIL